VNAVEPRSVHADLVAATRRRPPRVAVVLGSGLGGIVARTTLHAEAPFHVVPGLIAPTVAHHSGRVVLGEWAGVEVVLFQGRIHFYECGAWRQATEIVRLARHLGATTLVLTNSAGGIRPDLAPTNLMLLRDHIEWNRPYCWRAPGPGGLGGERPSPYSPRMNAAMLASARSLGLPLATGIYAAVTGPCYETRAEIRALRAWGADAVGMSTTREALTGVELGMEVVAVSGITNWGVGLGGEEVNHASVAEVAGVISQRMIPLLEAFLARLAADFDR
jgi:purine-nucleoside phosphorylase